MSTFKFPVIFVIIVFFFIFGCGDTGSSPFNSQAYQIDSKKHLYVVSGACYGGGVTTSAGPANTIAKFSLTTGALENVIIDYNLLAPGDSPVAIYEYDAENILVLVENAGGRRIDKVRKDGTGYSTHLVNATALSAAMRSILFLSDFSILVSKSSAIEKFNAAKARVTQGANPFINAPAAPCATSTTLISSVIAHSSGKIIYTHAAATPNNKIGVISSSGYAAGADCLNGTAAPNTTALPTRALIHSTGKLLVSYGSTTASSNFIYSYDFNGTSGAVTNPVAVFNDNSIVNGPSSMAENTDNGDVFVANVSSAFNTIERFHFSSNLLTRAFGNTFIPYGVYTRCVADLKVMK
ncbi:MAG: hypothetical protein ABL927_07135 [Bdellovibrionales bacterium]